MEITHSPSSCPLSPQTPRKRPRCHHVSANGIRCRYSAISQKADFCKHHLAPDPNDPVTMDSIWDNLAEKGAALDTAKNVRDSLCVIFYSLVEGKITEQRAGILCYILQTVLHAQRKIAESQERDGDHDIRKRMPAWFFDDNLAEAKAKSDAAAKATGDSTAPEAQTTVAGSAPDQASAAGASSDQSHAKNGGCDSHPNGSQSRRKGFSRVLFLAERRAGVWKDLAAFR